jgi:hypothetical protein
MHYHDIAIDHRAKVLRRRQNNTSKLDQAFIAAVVEAFPGWEPMSSHWPCQVAGMPEAEYSFARRTRSASLLTFTCRGSGIASVALLSGQNGREDFETLRDLSDWAFASRDKLPELYEFSLEPLRVKERPLIATVVWMHGFEFFWPVTGFTEVFAAAFFAWALRKDS